jgi:hypothetical protein
MSGLIFVCGVMGFYCLVFAFTRRQGCCWILAAIICFSAVFAINWTGERMKESRSLAHREGSEESRTGSPAGADDDQSHEGDGTDHMPEVGALD